MFIETFTQVRGFFHDNFRELFGAQAKADLMLIDESDPLETGIELSPTAGKKLQTISLLSGGEPSMTAVALLFSIYQVKPSPFCVLDELDAPLDETNIGRFLKMLDKFIDNSQFIIVTHNKRTMSRADVIYGVTMQEFGISKPVGVRMTTEDTRGTTKSVEQLEAPADRPRLESMDEQQERLTEIEAQEEICRGGVGVGGGASSRSKVVSAPGVAILDCLTALTLLGLRRRDRFDFVW